MDGRPDPDTSDGFDAEVSDVRRSRAETTSAPQARSPFQPRRTPRRRLIRVAVTLSTGMLALVVVLSSVSAVRDGPAGLASRLLPPPPPTLVPGYDLFSLLPNPPGVDVSLDGHVLAHLPFPGGTHPLRLSPGHHVFGWQSRIFPFPPLTCSVSVPSLPTDTCPVVAANAMQLPPEQPAVGRVIALDASVNAVFGQLGMAVQGALDASQSSALVQPGELYYSDLQGRAVVATQPLHALLSYQKIQSLAPGGPCEPRDPALLCRFPGQDCVQLCTVASPPATVARASGEWIAVALVGSFWRYTTLGGQVVADLITDAFPDGFAVLRITWNGSEWHVTSLLGSTPGLPATDDLVCTPARYWLEHNARWAFMLAGGHPGTAQFISDATPADGCLVVLDPTVGRYPPAVFLERFGVLLAVNAAANGPGADLPMADSAEQSLAHRLAAQAQLTF